MGVTTWSIDPACPPTSEWTINSGHVVETVTWTPLSKQSFAVLSEGAGTLLLHYLPTATLSKHLTR